MRDRKIQGQFVRARQRLRQTDRQAFKNPTERVD